MHQKSDKAGLICDMKTRMCTINTTAVEIMVHDVICGDLVSDMMHDVVMGDESGSA